MCIRDSPYLFDFFTCFVDLTLLIFRFNAKSLLSCTQTNGSISASSSLDFVFFLNLSVVFRYDFTDTPQNQSLLMLVYFTVILRCVLLMLTILFNKCRFTI